MKIDQAIEDVHETEADLAGRLRAIGERHAAEADVYHMAHTLARQCAQHLAQLAPHAERYGAKAAPDNVDSSPGLLETLQRKVGNTVRGTEFSGVLLIRDLRELYLAAHAAELCWVILSQAAKARRDAGLIEVTAACQEQALMRATWVRTKVKEAAPQVFAAG